MKIAIFHDSLDSIGGGEKVVLILAKNLKADLITTNLNKEHIKRLNFEDVNIISLGNTIKIPPIKQIHSSIKFAKCNFKDKYDFFIFSGNWAVFSAKKHKPNLWYCYTPVRVFYDLYGEFKNGCSFFVRPIFIFYVYIHKKFIEDYIKYINKIITISINSKNRLTKYHNKESKIIYPPVFNYPYKKNGDFWLSVNRLYPQKRISLQLDLFKELANEKLVIVGGYAKGDHSQRYVKKYLKNPPKNVCFLGNVTEKELSKLYSECKAFITTAQDEDFGISAVEAMAAGKPVVAINEGGYKESIIDKVNGILVNNLCLDELGLAIAEISKKPENYRIACEKRARKFSIEEFIKKIKKEINWK